MTEPTIAARLDSYGLRLPDADMAGLAALVADLQAAAATVRRPLSYADEPASIFHLPPPENAADEK